MYSNRLFILAYHSIADGSYLHSVPPSIFEKHIKFLLKHFQILSFNDFESVLLGDVKPKRNAVLITFDDGIDDNYYNAYPILKKYNVPVVIFICTSYVGKKHIGDRGFSFQFLSKTQMIEMRNSGLVSFQSHTANHPVLTNIPEVKVKKELHDSKNWIEMNLHQSCSAIAYPKGRYDQKIIAVTQKFYEFAFGIDNDGYVILPFSGDQTRYFMLPRMLISREVSYVKFCLMHTTLFWKLKKLKHLFFNCLYQINK